jgi:CRISPR/Cas system-associated exonuclease Cas4 (RecB family)
MKKQMLNVTDLTSYLFCKRKLWLRLVKGLREKPNKAMVIGEIKHKIMEMFSKTEQKVISNIQKNDGNDDKQKSIIKQYYKNYVEIFNYTIQKYKNKLQIFQIDENELFNNVWHCMLREINVRIKPIMQLIKQDIYGIKLWQLLTPKYITELKLECPAINLKGRIDRVQVDETNTIIPFEMKTRRYNGKIYDNELTQVVCYAVLLENKKNTIINTAFIEYKDKKIEIKIDRKMKDKVLELINEVYDLYNKNNAELTSNLAKCQHCSFKNVCFKK